MKLIITDAGFDTLEDIKNASVYELSKIDGFAETTAQYLLDGVNVLYQDIVEVLNTNKITIKGKETGGKLEGFGFFFTGKLAKSIFSSRSIKIIKKVEFKKIFLTIIQFNFI